MILNTTGAQVSPVAKFYDPIGDYIQLDYTKPEKAGELFLPGNAKKLDYIEAGVVATGPACRQVKKGDRLLLQTGALLLIAMDGNMVALTKEDRCLAVVKGSA